MNSVSRLRAAALEFGFDGFGVTALSIPERDRSAYERWVAEGSSHVMPYMTIDPAKRLDPRAVFPEARCAVTLAVSYFQGPLPPKPGPAYGRVARYAWGLDYHTVIAQRLAGLIAAWKEILGDVSMTLAIDTKPLLERALAAQAGLGFMGKNTVLIVPAAKTVPRAGFHVGSWVFLTEVLLGLELEADAAPAVDAGGCGGCTKCLSACPTDAFDGAYTLRADRCIAYLTIENKGEIPLAMREKVGDWIFGCDVCQDVCPFNARAAKTCWPEFEADRGAGAWLPLEDILSVRTGAEFNRRWKETPLSRAKRRGLLRNAAVVAGNSGDRSLVPVLRDCLSDDEPLVRDHARWALERLAGAA